MNKHNIMNMYARTPSNTPAPLNADASASSPSSCSDHSSSSSERLSQTGSSIMNLNRAFTIRDYAKAKEDEEEIMRKNKDKDKNKSTSNNEKTIHDLSKDLCGEHDDDVDVDEEEEEEEEMSEVTEALMLLLQTDEGDSITDILDDIKRSLRSITSDIKVMAGLATTIWSTQKQPHTSPSQSTHKNNKPKTR